MNLNGVMDVTLRNFAEFGKPALQKTIGGEFMHVFIVFLVRVQCRHKESSRSLSHLLMSFLFCILQSYIIWEICLVVNEEMYSLGFALKGCSFCENRVSM